MAVAFTVNGTAQSVEVDFVGLGGAQRLHGDLRAVARVDAVAAGHAHRATGVRVDQGVGDELGEAQHGRVRGVVVDPPVAERPTQEPPRLALGA